MTLKEAIESKKPFRRSGCRDWMYSIPGNHKFSLADVTSDDWELREGPLKLNVYIACYDDDERFGVIPPHLELAQFIGKKVNITVEDI